MIKRRGIDAPPEELGPRIGARPQNRSIVVAFVTALVVFVIGGTVYFEVQVLKSGTRQKVLVDPQSGKVVKTVTADNEDNERGHESDDD
jgi:hypothetical protein